MTKISQCKVLTEAEWDELLMGDHPALPDCCRWITYLRSVVRQIYSFDLDIPLAKDLLYEYDRASMMHDLSMFKPLVKLVEYACDKIDQKNLQLAEAFGCW